MQRYSNKAWLHYADTSAADMDERRNLARQSIRIIYNIEKGVLKRPAYNTTNRICVRREETAPARYKGKGVFRKCKDVE